MSNPFDCAEFASNEFHHASDTVPDTWVVRIQRDVRPDIFVSDEFCAAEPFASIQYDNPSIILGDDDERYPVNACVRLFI